MHVTMGASLDAIMVDIYKKELSPDGTTSYVLKSMNVSDAVEDCFQTIIICIGTRTTNPIWRLINYMTGKNPAFTNVEKFTNINCSALRQALLTFVRKRKSERKHSETPEIDVNLLSLMFEQPDVFSDEFIVDELIDFLVAGTQTTMLTT